jgi:hypothetical protein
MSSISSYDVFVDDHEDDDYIKKLDDLESGDSGSEDIRPISFKNTPVLFKSKIEENELDIIRIYLKCKKNVFNLASHHNKKYAVIMCGVSMLLSGSLVFIPFISSPHVDKFVFGAISLFLFCSLCFSKYSNFDIHQQQYKIISNKYAGLHSNVESFLAKFVYMTDKHTAFYEKIKEIETKLHWIKEDNRELLNLPYFIRLQVPFVSDVDIFQSIHGIEIEQNTLFSRYHNLKNEIDILKSSNRDESRLKYLTENKKKIKKTLKNTNYSDIKEKLEKEYIHSLIKYDC